MATPTKAPTLDSYDLTNAGKAIAELNSHGEFNGTLLQNGHLLTIAFSDPRCEHLVTKVERVDA